MVQGVEPLAHDQAFSALLFDLVHAERLQEHEANGSVESSGVQPAWQKSLAHERGEVALLDVKHVGHGEEGAETVGGLNDALSVVKTVDHSLVDLPIVVIHVSSSIK